MEMRVHRSKQRNLLKIDKVIAWVESEVSQLLWIDGKSVLRRSIFNLSLLAPLLVLGESNYETILILRHFCDDQLSYKLRGHRFLIQSLLYQIFEQHPQVFARRRDSLTREGTSSVVALWDLFLTCLDDVDAQCTFIIIENVDLLRNNDMSGVEEGDFVIQKLDALIQENRRLTKILLTATLARDQTSSSEGRAALTAPRRRESLDIVQDELALVPHKLIEIQQRRCEAVSFAEITMLYTPNTTVYTLEDQELRAFLVVELSGMEPRASESYSPLRIRAWSVDHDGQNIARRFHDLTIPQFSGRRAIKSLRYVPAGYVLDENKRRKELIDRGKLWWRYSSGYHHVVTEISKTQVRKRSSPVSSLEVQVFCTPEKAKFCDRQQERRELQYHNPLKNDSAFAAWHLKLIMSIEL